MTHFLGKKILHLRSIDSKFFLYVSNSPIKMIFRHFKFISRSNSLTIFNSQHIALCNNKKNFLYLLVEHNFVDSRKSIGYLHYLLKRSEKIPIFNVRRRIKTSKLD